MLNELHHFRKPDLIHNKLSNISQINAKWVTLDSVFHVQQQWA
jgi:hypothetical protein